MAQVAVIGVGQSVHAPERNDVAHAELLQEAIDEALDDAGIELADIDNAVTASLDFYDGRTIANMAVAEVVGSYLKAESRVCSDAIHALTYGWSRIADGQFRLGLITAHCKESEGNLHDIENAAFDPFIERRLDADDDVVAGLYARTAFAHGAADRENAAALVAAARASASRNPKVAPLEMVDTAAVLESPVLATPLRTLDRAPRSDGSCVLVIASADTVAALDADPVWITGAAISTGRYWSDRHPLDMATLESARDEALAMAGWSSNVADVIEVSAKYSFQLQQFAAVLGADESDAGGAFNPSGGRHAGNPTVVAGLSRVAECVEQIRGRAGDRQVSRAEKAIAHGVTGLGAQAHAVVTMETAA